jgi:hypothetical protein
MTIYTATDIAKNWKMARSRQSIAGDDDLVGNLSFQTNSSTNKKVHSSSRGVGKIWSVSDARGSLPISTIM